MKRIFLILALIFMIMFPVFSQTGTYTTNEFFYLPEYGAYGPDEFEEYETYMQIADTQIEANKTASDDENIEDVVGAMSTSNTETFISVDYQDSDGTTDYVVPVKDEDNMASNSATFLVTQQSIKSYADTLHALQYLKTEIDALSELETIWSKDVTDSDELASALTAYYLKTAIDTIGEVETIWIKDITDSDELASALADYYLKTAIDELSEVETIYGKNILDTTELNTFSELQTLVADKTLVNEEDVFTIDANWVNTANPWADNEVDDDITIDLATAAEHLLMDAKEENTSAIVIGQPVYQSGTTGLAFPKVGLADADVGTKAHVLGLAASAFVINETGTVMISGILTGVDSDGATAINPSDQTWQAADKLYLHTTPGGLTNIEPTVGRVVEIGYILYGESNNDAIVIHIQVTHPHIEVAADEDIVLRLGDTDGSTAIIIKNYSNTPVASIDDQGNADFNSYLSNVVLCSKYDNPDDAITAIGGSDKTLLVTEAETCDNDFTVPTNVTVKFERGGKWTINDGVTVTFNGQLDAGLWQIFSYTGTGTLAGTPVVECVYPQWWGATEGTVGLDYEVNTDAFDEAIKFKNVFISQGIWYLHPLAEIEHGVHIEGVGINTTLKFRTTLDCITLSKNVDYTTQISIKNIAFRYESEIPSSFINVNTALNVRLEGLIFYSTAVTTASIINTQSYGLELRKCRWNIFTGIALKLLSGAGEYSNAINIIDCDFTGISEEAILLEGGDLHVFGGVIESCASDGMVKLTNYHQVSFHGTYFEGSTNDIYILGSSSEITPNKSVSLTGCYFASAGTVIDVEKVGMWTLVGCKSVGLTIKTNNGNFGTAPRIFFMGCSGMTIDNTLDNWASDIGRGQVFFPATQNASTDANVLDDYEEGTFTPALKFGGNSDGMIYSAQSGIYTKIGNLVTISFQIALTNKGTSNGDVLITGLPFTCKNDDSTYAPVLFYLSGITFANVPIGRISINTTTMVLVEMVEDGNVTALTDANFVNNSRMFASATYFTD